MNTFCTSCDQECGCINVTDEFARSDEVGVQLVSDCCEAMVVDESGNTVLIAGERPDSYYD